MVETLTLDFVSGDVRHGYGSPISTSTSIARLPSRSTLPRDQAQT
jgi:hypothetical protein